MDDDELILLAATFRKSMTGSSGPELDAALAELGWAEMLSEIPDVAVPMVFGLLGETGAHASLINDVIGTGTAPLPYTGGSWVVWARDGDVETSALDTELPLRIVESGDPIPLAAGRRALAWWLVGTSRAMLSLAREHALSRNQFGKPVAGFQAIRHKLAETLVAIEGAEAAAQSATDDLGSILAKAAAGQAALTASKHCQQILGGIGFTAEHDLHRHIRRAYVLDGLLGSSRELTREAGAQVRAQGKAPRLVHL